MSEVTTYRTIRCTRYCDNGYRGMDNCNSCGCTGAMLAAGGNYYPNTREGWIELRKDFPSVPPDEDDLALARKGRKLRMGQ